MMLDLWDQSRYRCNRGQAEEHCDWYESGAGLLEVSRTGRPSDSELVNEYLSYLADRNYSPQTVRVYGFALLAFCRWLASEDIASTR